MKKIIIFSSNGGGGHTAVANALKDYLKHEYEIEIINIFTEIIRPFDAMLNLTPQKITGEDIYNYAIAQKWYGFLNFYYRAGAWYFKTCQVSVSDRIGAYVDLKKPDLIISVVPLINNIILEVAQKRNLPFLLVPTDLDINTFIFDIKAPSYHKFKIALAFDDSKIQQKIVKAGIPTASTLTTGFILRPDFFEHKDKKSIKRTYMIPAHKPVVLLLLGGVGLQSLYTYAQNLVNLNYPAHLLLCVGRQKMLYDKIKTIPFPAHITTTTINFTDRISDLMAVSDILLTKSGSVSVCESIYMNLPLVLDATSSSLLTWEKYNHEFIKHNNFGTTISEFEKLPDLISNLLAQGSTLASYQKKLAQYEKKHGGNEIKRFIKQMLEF